MEIVNAQIGDVTLSNADHGCLSSFLIMDYGDGSSQGFGGYQLYYPNTKGHLGSAGMFIWRVLETVGVSDWSDLTGKFIRVRIEDGSITAIGHITKDKWFCPKEEFKNLE
jgi:hypothetical protein